MRGYPNQYRPALETLTSCVLVHQFLFALAGYASFVLYLRESICGCLNYCTQVNLFREVCSLEKGFVSLV